MTRALARAVAEHPALAKVTVDSTRTPCLVGLADSAVAYGPQATLAGAVEMLAALASLIGRLIGDDLASTLLEESLINSSTPRTPGTPVATKLAAVRSASRTSDAKQP